MRQSFEFNSIFDIPNPHELYCTVWMYRVHHSLLVIKVHYDDFERGAAWLIFDSVSYFDGPMGWKGAKFTLATQDETLNMLRRLGLNKNMPLDFLMENSKLYILTAETDWLQDSDSLTIRILARDCHVSHKRYTIGDFFA